MKKRASILAAVFFGVLLSSASGVAASPAGATSAADHAKAANQSTGTVKIVSLGNWVGVPSAPNESLLVTTDQVTKTNPAGCGFDGWYVLSAASAVSRSMLLAAITTNGNVTMQIYGGGCVDGAPVIVHVGLVR